MLNPIKFFKVIFILLLIHSCKNESKDSAHNEGNLPQEKIKSQIIRVNQLQIQKETDEMDAYEKSHQLHFIKTNSGIRYFVYKHSQHGDSIKNNMIVKLNFELKLLDGTLCYSSKQDGAKEIKVGEDQVESGLHKGLLYLKRGDKALLLIPSVLAHGLLGDFNKIPPQMPIVIDVFVGD